MCNLKCTEACVNVLSRFWRETGKIGLLLAKTNTLRSACCIKDWSCKRNIKDLLVTSCKTCLSRQKCKLFLVVQSMKWPKNCARPPLSEVKNEKSALIGVIPPGDPPRPRLGPLSGGRPDRGKGQNMHVSQGAEENFLAFRSLHEVDHFPPRDPPRPPATP